MKGEKRRREKKIFSKHYFSSFYSAQGLQRMNYDRWNKLEKKIFKIHSKNNNVLYLALKQRKGNGKIERRLKNEEWDEEWISCEEIVSFRFACFNLSVKNRLIVHLENNNLWMMLKINFLLRFIMMPTTMWTSVLRWKQNQNEYASFSMKRGKFSHETSMQILNISDIKWCVMLICRTCATDMSIRNFLIHHQTKNSAVNSFSLKTPNYIKCEKDSTWKNLNFLYSWTLMKENEMKWSLFC